VGNEFHTFESVELPILPLFNGITRNLMVSVWRVWRKKGVREKNRGDFSDGLEKAQGLTDGRRKPPDTNRVRAFGIQFSSPRTGANSSRGQGSY